MDEMVRKTDLSDVIKDWLRFSTPHRIYDTVRLFRTDFEPYVFETPLGDLHLEIPSQVEFGEVYSNTPGGHEPLLLNAYRDEMTDSTVFFDIGGQYGYNVAAALSAGVRPENIYTFEASKFNAKILGRNFPSDVTIVNSKVGSKTGVWSVTIDDFTKEYKPPTVVKIDVEGGEVSVLRGMASTLLDFAPTLFVEIHPQFLCSGGEREVFDILQSQYSQLFAADHRDHDAEFSPLDDYDRPSDRAYLLYAPSQA